MLNRPHLVAVTLLVTMGIGIVPALTHRCVAENSDHLEVPDFSRDIRPILSDHCFACHGPDEQTRKADLRLDTAEGLSSVVTAGNASDSELLSRVHSSDADILMPPPDFHKPLSTTQQALLKHWIESRGSSGGLLNPVFVC